MSAQQKITINYATRTGTTWPLYIAKEAGYFTKYGLDVDISVLTGDDTLSEATHELLGRALGASSSLDVSVASVTFDAGDVMILLGHRVPGEVDRRALVSHVERSGENEHLLVVRFDESDRAIEELGTREVPEVVYRPNPLARAMLVAASLIVGLALLTAWAQ